MRFIYIHKSYIYLPQLVHFLAFCSLANILSCNSADDILDGGATGTPNKVVRGAAATTLCERFSLNIISILKN
jgi:hypothetical protein